MKKIRIGVIGFGNFSKLMVRYLSPYADVAVSTRSELGPHQLDCRFVSAAEALAQPIVIPSMPSQVP